MISELHLPMVTLNSVFEQYINQEIDILQMDVEEMELEILSVSKETLRFVKRIVVEWHLEDTKQKLITLLEKEGFRLIYEEPRDYGDLYFEK